MSLCRYINNYTYVYIGFYAVAGWDPTSGLGSPDFTLMSKYFMDLVSNLVNTFSITQVSIYKCIFVFMYFHIYNYLYKYLFGNLLINEYFVDLLSNLVITYLITQASKHILVYI